MRTCKSSTHSVPAKLGGMNLSCPTNVFESFCEHFHARFSVYADAFACAGVAGTHAFACAGVAGIYSTQRAQTYAHISTHAESHRAKCQHSRPRISSQPHTRTLTAAVLLSIHSVIRLRRAGGPDSSASTSRSITLSVRNPREKTLRQCWYSSCSWKR